MMLFSSIDMDKIRAKLSPVALLIFCGAQVLDIINLTGLIFSVQSVSVLYNVSLDQASWILSAYALTFGSFIMLGGRMGDYMGHRSVFIFGMFLVAVCSIINATVQNIYVLYVFRAVQGVGAAFSIPSSYALIAYNFKGRTQALAFAAVGSAAAVGGIVGVLVGGGFAESHLHYRGVMYLSFAFSSLFTLLIYPVVNETPKREFSVLKKLDYIGSIIIVCGMILVVFGFTSAPGRWRSARVIAPIILGVLLLGFFIVYENYIALRVFHLEPLVPKKTWKYRNLLAVFLMSPLIFASLQVLLFTGANEIMLVGGKSAMATAVYFIAYGVAFCLACIVGGATYGKISTKYFMVAGCVMNVVGFVLYAQANGHSYWRFYFPGNLLLSIGTAFFMSTFGNVVSNSAPLANQGLVIGMCQTAGQLGTAVGLGISTSEIGDATNAQNYRTSYYTLLAYSAAAALIALFFIKDNYGPVGQQDLVEENAEKDLPEDDPEKGESSSEIDLQKADIPSL